MKLLSIPALNVNERVYVDETENSYLIMSATGNACGITLLIPLYIDFD